MHDIVMSCIVSKEEEEEEEEEEKNPIKEAHF